MNKIELANKNTQKYFKNQVIVDTQYNVETTITDMTSNSIEVFLEKRTNKGINCTQWFYIDDFEKRFETLSLNKIPMSDRLRMYVQTFSDISYQAYVKSKEYGDSLCIHHKNNTITFLLYNLFDSEVVKTEKKIEMCKGAEDFLNRLTIATNRSKGQTLFLLGLLDDDLFKLMELEEKIKNNFVGYCPESREECDKILAMDNGSKWFKLNFKIESKI